MNIVAYVKTGCGWCKGVTDLLHEHQIPFEEKNVMENMQYMFEMEKKSHQMKSPTVEIDGEILANTDRDQVEQYLKNKGIIK